MNIFWIGFEKRASEAAFDRSGRELAAIEEEKMKYDQSAEKTDFERTKERRDTEPRTTTQGNISGGHAGDLI